jgi:hypothetical protein
MTMPFYWGDIFSYRASDQYAVGCIGNIGENAAAAPSRTPYYALTNATNTNQYDIRFGGHFLARYYTGLGGSLQVGKHSDQFRKWDDSSSAQSTFTDWGSVNYGTASLTGLGRTSYTGRFPYPNGADGALWMSPVYIHHNNGIRGYYKGMWDPLHHNPMNHGDAFTVSGGNLNGKSFIAQSIPCLNNLGGVVQGQVIIEYSDTWN